MKTSFFKLESLGANKKSDFFLKKSKILVGRDSGCDIVIHDPGLSLHHCYLIIGKDDISVIDLATTNGTFINGEKIHSSKMSAGDVLTLSGFSLLVKAVNAEELQDTSWDEVESSVVALAAMKEKAQEEIKELATTTADHFEYVIAPQVTIRLHDLHVDLEEQEPLEVVDTPFDVTQITATKILEVILYSSGNIIDISYIETQNEDLLLSSTEGKNKIWFPDLKQDIAFIVFKQSGYHVQCPEGFTQEGDPTLSESGLLLTFGVHQLAIKVLSQKAGILSIPWLTREKVFYKKTMGMALAMFAPFLLLLFISLPEIQPEPVKQLTIIYKPAPVSPMSSASKSATSALPQVASASVNKVEVQTTSSPSAATKVAAPETKYQFKSSVSLDEVTDATTGTATTSTRQTASVKGFGASSSAINGKTGGSDKMAVGSLGGGEGTGVATGAKGLATKKGFDHSYIEQKTVVLGSMDPELLRKILQEYLPQFRHCYQQELVKANNEIKGVIDLDFQISADGKAARIDVKAKDSRFTHKGTECMASVLKIIDFPKPKGGGVVDVKQPLNFFAETQRI